MRGAESVCVDVWAVFSRWALAAVGTSEFGLYGVIGGMAVIVILAYTMRLLRISLEAVGRAENRALCRAWKCCGYECEANIYSKNIYERSLFDR